MPGQIETTEDHRGLRIVDSTSLSLLVRLKAARPEATDWQRLQGIYLPLIQRWLGAHPVCATRRMTWPRRCSSW